MTAFAWQRFRPWVIWCPGITGCLLTGYGEPGLSLLFHCTHGRPVLLHGNRQRPGQKTLWMGRSRNIWLKRIPNLTCICWGCLPKCGDADDWLFLNSQGLFYTFLVKSVQKVNVDAMLNQRIAIDSILISTIDDGKGKFLLHWTQWKALATRRRPSNEIGMIKYPPFCARDTSY